MESYIKASSECCKDVCSMLASSGELDTDGLRLGLIAFRDFHPNDGYVTKDFGGFTDNVDTVIRSLSSLTAGGGYDFPEAVATALDKALGLSWRQDAVKVAVLITDAPPHGIGENEDKYEDKNPLTLARDMSRRGICLFMIACEPTLSNDYKYAHDFYRALVRLTGCVHSEIERYIVSWYAPRGLMIPLTNTSILAPLIIGFALEQMALEQLIQEFKDFVLERKNQMEKFEIVGELQGKLKRRGQTLVSVDTTQVYKEPQEAESTISTWLGSQTMDEARGRLQNITFEKRVPDEFLIAWPKHPVEITLKNLGDYYIQIHYRENGQDKFETLGPNHICQPTKFIVNKPYLFNLKKGRKTEPTSRTFTREADWNLAVYFD